MGHAEGGEVEWQFQKEDAERVVHRLAGVSGVTNSIAVKPHPPPSGLKKKIEEALTRSAELDAQRILVEVQDSKVILRGIDVGAESRVVVHGFGTETSGVPPSWAAAADLAGVGFLFDLSDETAAQVEEHVRRFKANTDLTIASIHWGSNWGYEVEPEFVRFAHRLIDGGVDLVHGHSSHHPRPIEVYRDRLVLYGCGDFINDYEGIEGHQVYRGDLALMYFATLGREGNLVQLRMVPMQIRKMRLNRASRRDGEWLKETLSVVSRDFGSWVEAEKDGALLLRWDR